ncbi:redox-sensing transcriptional repressor Rex [Verrucomicrobiota bacterium]
MDTQTKAMPHAVTQRLPQYFAYIKDIKKPDDEYVHFHEIAYALGLTSSTVRMDFTHLNIQDGGKHGYKIKHLKHVLIHVLDINKKKRLAIVGAGNLGKALATHGNLEEYSFDVRTILDINPELVGSKIGRLTVKNIDCLTTARCKDKINIAVPSSSAQEVAYRLITSGVKGLLNLAFTRIVAPQKVVVADSCIMSDFLRLSSLMIN